MAKNATSVIYQTPDGKNKQGYIIDGKTYDDASGTQRVAVGSTVPTAGGMYTLTGIGSVKTPQSTATDIRKAYDDSKSHLSGALDARKQGITAATRNTYNQINDQRYSAEKQYADANRTAYQAYVNASNPYGAAEEQRARLGLSNSGYAETSKMQLANTYQQSIGENARARDEYLRELDNAYRDAKYKGDIELANAIAEYENLVYQHGIDAAEAIAAQETAAYNAGIVANQAIWERDKYQKEVETDNARYEREQAMAEQENERNWEYKNRESDRNWEYKNRESDRDWKYKNQQSAQDWAYKQNMLAQEREFADLDSEYEHEQDLWERAYRLAMEGYSNKEIADTLGVNIFQLALQSVLK